MENGFQLNLYPPNIPGGQLKWWTIGYYIWVEATWQLPPATVCSFTMKKLDGIFLIWKFRFLGPGMFLLWSVPLTSVQVIQVLYFISFTMHCIILTPYLNRLHSRVYPVVLWKKLWIKVAIFNGLRILGPVGSNTKYMILLKVCEPSLNLDKLFVCLFATEEMLYSIKHGQTMAHYCTHLCWQQTILHSISHLFQGVRPSPYFGVSTS